LGTWFLGLTTLNGGGGGVGGRKENLEVNLGISLGLQHPRLPFDTTPKTKP